MDFNISVDVDVLFDIYECLCVLEGNADCFAWEDFSDRGTACYKPTKADAMKWRDESILLGLVRTVMKKGTVIHISLADKVASVIGKKFISYDYLCKAVSRILSGVSSSQELIILCNVSKLVKAQNNIIKI